MFNVKLLSKGIIFGVLVAPLFISSLVSVQINSIKLYLYSPNASMGLGVLLKGTSTGKVEGGEGTVDTPTPPNPACSSHTCFHQFRGYYIDIDPNLTTHELYKSL